MENAAQEQGTGTVFKGQRNGLCVSYALKQLRILRDFYV